MSRGWVGTAVLWISLGVACACGGASGPNEQQDEAPPAPTVNPVADQTLRDAALEGLIDVMVAAVNDGARIDAVDADGRTALMYAAFNGHTECVRWLLDRGAAEGAREYVGRTALMFASSGPFPDTAQLLLESGSNPDDADEYEGWTPLMFAAAEGQLEVVEVLLKFGADPSVVDNDGDVAADHAAQNRHSAVEGVLREAMLNR
jgi:ankyrin repeat protein